MELKTARGRLFLFIALIVALPLLNYNFHFIESGKLDGVAPAHTLTSFTPQSWWDGTFQQDRDALINDSIGLRPDLVRMNNQLDYWLFRKLNGSSVVLGKDDYLFEHDYINEYNGLDYMGDSAVLETCVRLKKLQDTMAKLGKTLLVVHAPSKAYYFPEKIPAYLYRGAVSRTNYNRITHCDDSLGVNQLDFNQIFLKMKDTSRYPLIPKKGTHWSRYGAALAMNCLAAYLERQRHIRLPHVNLTGLKVTDTPRGSDDDLARITNLIYPITNERLAYPDLETEDTAGKVRPRMLFIGDSFLWLWTDRYGMESISQGWEFWYYFSQVWTQQVVSGQAPMQEMEHYNWQASMGKADCIILVNTAMNLGSFTARDGFVQSAYRYYFPVK